MISEAELRALWDGIEHEAFRLETLDSYAAPHERETVQRYLTGEPYVETDVARAWAGYVATMVTRGITYHRVHVVHSPLSAYLRYEMEWGYTRYAARGERAYILDTAEAARPWEIPGYDFWLLDNAVVRMWYEGDGTFAGADVLPPTALDAHCRARDAAIDAAVPFEEWWAAHPSEHRESWLAA